MTPEQVNDAILQDWVNELKASGGRWVETHGGRLLRELFPPGYKEWLTRFHDHLKPDMYLEIGVASGATLRLARPETLAIGVDPKSDAKRTLGCIIYPCTSDDFFASCRKEPEFDLVFIDGLHLFEQALRDVLNSEKVSKPTGVILVHDIIPLEHAAGREVPPEGGSWTGDVWKIVPILRAYRPDLKLELIECAPSGLLVITNLNSNAPELHLDETVAQWIGVPVTEYVKPADLLVEEPELFR